MKGNILKRSRIASMLFLVLALGLVAGSAWAAGVSWQVGDIVVCFGNGQCKVLRNTTGNILVALDEISDNGFVGIPGFTYSAATDNALHVLVADAGTGTQSSIVKYSIASQNFLIPPPNTLSHTIIATFDGSVGTNSEGIKAFALDSAGHIFVGNSNPATIAEIDQNRPFWRTNTQYPLNFIIVDSNGNLEQVTAAGTSGLYPNSPFHPAWSQTQGNSTADGTVTWNNLATTTLVGSFPVSTAVPPQSAWTSGRCYPGNPPCLTGSSITTILDTNGHLQKVLTPGTSGGTHPTWNDAMGTTNDNAVTWQDGGHCGGEVEPACPVGAWMANTPYSVGAQITDPFPHIQTVTVAGTSGPSIPSFNDLGGMTTDGLTWTDTGLPGFGTNCVGNQLASLDLGTGNNPAVYFTSGGIVQKVATPLSGSSPCTIVADFGPNVTLSTIKVVPAGAIPQNPGSDALLVLAKGTVDLDTGAPTTDPDETSGEDTTDICTNAAPATPTSCALLLDNTGAIVARYSIPNTNLQALALDPLVANCTGNACATSTSQPAPTVRSGNFWVGDGDSDTFYRFAFAGGAPASFTATLPTGCIGACNIQAMAIYGGEGANQPDLALLATGTLSPPISTNANTESGTFLQNLISTSLYGPNSNPNSFAPAPANLYASLVDESTCFNDGVYNSGTNTYANNGLPCRQTTPTAPVNPGIVVKVDVPVGSSAALPSTETLITGFQTLPLPNGNGTTDSSTDVFVDMAFDITISVGNTDSSGPIHSVHSLHEVPVVASQGTANCTYSTPVPGACYKTNRTNLNFNFTCPGLSASQFQSMQPTLALKQILPGQAGRQINLQGTNNKGPYRFVSTGPAPFWTFQWNLNGAPAGTYTGTTFDATGVQSFPTTFFLKPSCP